MKPIETDHQSPSSSGRSSGRIIGAIVTKDMVDALKNKTTLTVLVCVVFLVVLYRLLPILEGTSETPFLLVHDAGNSTLIAKLDESPAVKLYTYPSETQLKKFIAEGEEPEMGLALPADFDERLATEGKIEIQGYVVQWVGNGDMARLKRDTEALLNELVGAPVQIRLEGGKVPLQPETRGAGMIPSWAMVLVSLMVGISFIPNLMFEEKRTKTLAALLVSPASPAHIAVAKAIVGLAYGLACLGIVFAANAALIVHWDLAILAGVCGSLFAVSIGLLLGLLLDNRQQLMIWGQAVLFPLFIPIILVMKPGILPGTVSDVLRWLPSVTLSDMFRYSFAGQVPLSLYAARLAAMLACTALLLAVVAWRVRRME